nr:hypothetical protein [Xanthomonas hyacinthi]
MRRTTAVSAGWMTLVRESATVLPGATATMSSLPRHAHNRATQKNATMVRIVQRAVGETGVSISSRWAGRNARSSSRRAGASSARRAAQAERNTPP